MHNAMGIIFGNTGSGLLQGQGLALDSPVAAIPFGGRYRLLDFALSSMVNSGIRTVGLVTPYHYRPMLDHLGAGKDWFLDRKTGGLFILPGAIHGLIGYDRRFRIKDLMLNIEFLKKDFSKNVVVSCCDQVFNINYQSALEFHENRDADVTLIYEEISHGLTQDRSCLQIDGQQKVYGIRASQDYKMEKDEQASPKFVDILIIRRELLLKIIEGYKCIEDSDLMDPLIDNLASLKVYAYLSNSYLGKIHSIQDYFNRNMDLLQPEIRTELFSHNPIHTKIEDTPPTKFGLQAKVNNSLISCGCSIDGEVENSILSREVVIKPGCRITNSIIMQKCLIESNVVLENVILDKFVEIKEGNVLKGSKNNPLVLKRRVIN